MYRRTKEISSTPWPLQQYARTLIAKPSGKGGDLPNVILKKEGIPINRKKVMNYAEVCGFSKDREFVPITFPHILAFALHMELLLEKGFPYKLMGMVHINNTIIQHKPIPFDAILTIEVYFDEMKEHRKGKVIPLITKVYSFGELVWESRSENLKMIKTKGEKVKKEPEPALEGDQQVWELNTYAGIRYAFAGGSGDFNPIHLLPLTAKPFGFKRHIIHGMWTKARAAAALEEKIGTRPASIHVDFKLPVYLPGKVTFTEADRSDGVDFEVRDAWNEKPHLKGSVQYISQD